MDSTYEQIIDVFTETLIRRLSDLTVSPDKLKDCMINVVNVQTNMLPCQFVTHTSLEDFWTKHIRPNGTWMSLILSLTTEFRVRAGLTAATWKEFVEVVSVACSVSGSNSLMDKVLQERTTSLTDITNLLESNPWAVTVILIHFTDRRKFETKRLQAQPQ